MSDRTKLKPAGRTLTLLLARAAGEAGPGMNQVTLFHDPWCPSLRTRNGALLTCRCSPEIEITPSADVI